MAATHRLLSARRAVARERLPEYERAWERVRLAAAAAGMHAWLFRAAAHAETYLEFLEWPADVGDAVLQPALGGALRALQEGFPGTVERWDEVPPPYLPEEGPP